MTNMLSISVALQNAVSILDLQSELWLHAFELYMKNTCKCTLQLVAMDAKGYY